MTLVPAARIAVTLAVFAATGVALVVWKPHAAGAKAVWTLLGAVTLLALGLVTPTGVVAVTACRPRSALLFLLALLLLIPLVEASGFFEWAADLRRYPASPRAIGRALYRNVLLLGAAVTVGGLARLAIGGHAHPAGAGVRGAARAAGAPVRHRVRLRGQHRVAPPAHLQPHQPALRRGRLPRMGFAPFAARMALPQLAALAATYGLCRLPLPAAELPRPASSIGALGDPGAAVAHRAATSRAAATVLALVFAGYFLAPLARVEPYVVAFHGRAAVAPRLRAPHRPRGPPRAARTSRGSCSSS